ncbi:ABC transporter ATP-binding protein [Thermophilibacter provencensis]|uniref:Fatty acid ABC transporter ATP-binding/permease protein n=1 Tax=Thermophilibacter provencensis TaxID=1852386 RepID=A0A921GIX6_9ACTN|nr:ABC transporter ATP-binding protein [Thermophilibacter provencensis]HJF45988.1 ABC transporter ATP-binding protein/permease [Thermophilibacter provencensis]
MSRNMHRGRAPKSMGRTALRVLKMLRGFYPVMLPAVACCILIQCVVQAMPNVFMERALTVVGQTWESGDWAAAQPQVFANAAILAALYFASLICNAVWQQCMAIITQGSLKKFRCLMFDHMQDLPIRYFDTHQHGDVMSYYTNDIDAMRQMIAQSLPQLFLTMLMLCSVGCIMLWYSLPLTLVVVGGAAIMALLGKTLASRSAKNFLRTQRAVAAVEGLVEEVMNGEKVVKVFSHERQIERAFDELNDEYQDAACTANSYANTLMPILMNAGNLLYVIVAVAIGVFLVLGIPNPAISGLPLTIAVGVPFLNMTKQFANQIGQISNQVNSVVMGLAGAERIFELLDEEPEQDEGYVELVACTIDQDGTVRECQRRDGHWAGQWAWKHPHQADGTVTYTPLAGDVRLFGVDFAYEPGHTVLHDVSLYAKPGQKVAFVGATGAGKTTITNLINRFYDIEDGKIRYDWININKIKKPDLRRSLGVVLQDVNLFTGTVMDNIRYGRLDATDEECIAAARLAGADDFVRRLPDGYETMLTDNGANLSQGQRQLLSIARAAVADPPVMVLDEATSSIDTRTEAIVQRGMDALMTGRTTFVIAHRLSTVRNSDVIIVLDHGRIIERGTHDELIAKKGTYYQLYTGAFELE